MASDALLRFNAKPLAMFGLLSNETHFISLRCTLPAHQHKVNKVNRVALIGHIPTAP